MIVALPVAVLAGLVSFASPCVLPLLPAYLSYATGLGVAQLTEGTGRRRTLLAGTVGFVLGFAVVFVVTGAVIGGVGSLLVAYQRPISIAVGGLTIVLGAMFAGLLPFGPEFRVKAMPAFSVAASPLLGAVFGLGWTPCVGPALATVLSLSMTEGSAGRGALLAFAYALGLGLPFIAAGLAFGRMKRLLAWLGTHQRGVQIAGGVLLMVVGLALMTGLWDSLSLLVRQWLANFEAPI
ncbi:MAG: cytochrome c biogenesis protein CcdA [Propionibacteriaceae bacterium]|nr:cytochrome c biogenesis protein CcdA [Propionibacteriaceae bacterium]